MKETIIRASAAVLSLLLMLSIIGCKDKSDPTPDRSDPQSSAVSDASSDTPSDPSSDTGEPSDTLPDDSSSDSDTPVIPTPAPTVDDEDDEDDWDDDERELAENEKPSTAFSSTKFGKYQYVWGDEFNSTELDNSKWNVLLHSNDNYSAKRLQEGDAELSKVFEVKNGTANSQYIHYYDPTNTLIKYAAAAGMNTKNTMSYRYGYLEVRSRMSFNKMASAIWLVNGGALNSPAAPYCGLEIDVFETLASLDSVTPNIHRWYKDGRHSDLNALKGAKPYTFFDTTNLANEYHLYGFEWTPTEISMYVDNVKYWTLDTTVSFDDDSDTDCYHLPMYLMVSSAGGFSANSTWLPYDGAILSDDVLPLTQSIDWVRLYQDPSVAGNQLNTKK